MEEIIKLRLNRCDYIKTDGGDLSLDTIVEGDIVYYLAQKEPSSLASKLPNNQRLFIEIKDQWLEASDADGVNGFADWLLNREGTSIEGQEVELTLSTHKLHVWVSLISFVPTSEFKDPNTKIELTDDEKKSYKLLKYYGLF